MCRYLTIRLSEEPKSQLQRDATSRRDPDMELGGQCVCWSNFLFPSSVPFAVHGTSRSHVSILQGESTVSEIRYVVPTYICFSLAAAVGSSSSCCWSLWYAEFDYSGEWHSHSGSAEKVWVCINSALLEFVFQLARKNKQNGSRLTRTCWCATSQVRSLT